MIRIRKLSSHFGAGLLLVSAWLLAGAAAAQDHTPPSLRLVPADAATYGVTLHGREELNAILKSKAWARVKGMPSVKMVWQMVEGEWDNPDGKLASLRKWYEQPGNADLVRFLGELFEEEVFTYGGKNSAEFAMLLQEIQTTNQFAPLMQLMKDGAAGASDPTGRFKIILQALAERPEHIVIPDTVVGFKLSRTKPAQVGQWLDRLEKVTNQVPGLQGKMKKTKSQGADVYALTLSGDMIPWNMIPLAMLEDRPGEYDKLIKHLKKTKLTIALTTRSNYLLLGLGEGTAALDAVGEGRRARLADQPELAPLAKFAARRITNVSYISKAHAEKISGAGDVDELAGWVKDLLKDANLPPDKRAKIMKDVKALAAELKKDAVQPGAQFSFAFSTARGLEEYSYDYSKNHGVDASKPLSLLRHVGGQPLAFVIGRSAASAKDYDLLVRMIKMGHEYVDEFLIPDAPENVREPYAQFMKQAKPLFKRLNEANKSLLIPSLGDEAGFVLDGRLKSKQWHPAMPGSDKELAIPELAVLQSLKDAKKFRQALNEYREVYNGLVDVVGNIVPNLPDIKLPAPKEMKTKTGSLYTFHLPQEYGLDPRIAPTAGISDRLAVFTLSQDHAKRLLMPTPLKEKGIPFQTDRPLAGAAYFDWAGFVDLAGPWVEYGLVQTNQGNNVIEQVQTALEVLKVLRSHSSATYVENGIVVTHGETIIRDLER